LEILSCLKKSHALKPYSGAVIAREIPTEFEAGITALKCPLERSILMRNPIPAHGMAFHS
jgi:hypothetical protein